MSTKTEGPECTCTPFVFAEDTAWQTTIHGSQCPRLCTCPMRGGPMVGPRSRKLFHFEECGWYEPPKPWNPGPVKGQKAQFMVLDEWAE